jgi:hypothetical protein
MLCVRLAEYRISWGKLDFVCEYIGNLPSFVKETRVSLLEVGFCIVQFFFGIALQQFGRTIQQ